MENSCIAAKTGGGSELLAYNCAILAAVGFILLSDTPWRMLWHSLERNVAKDVSKNRNARRLLSLDAKPGSQLASLALTN